MVRVNHSGLRDWLGQRITAIILGLYVIFIFAFFLKNQPLYFAQWQALFQNSIMKIATLIVLISILWHAWIGLWVISTDYIKSITLRLFLQVAILILLLGYVAWGIEILWVRG